MYGTLPHVLTIPDIPPEFTVIQDLIPLAENGGHVLLMPNKHTLSFAQIHDQQLLGIAIEVVLHALWKVFNQNEIFIFEHGPGYINKKSVACGGCHMDHAHGHFLLLPKGSDIYGIKEKMESILQKNGWNEPAKHSVASHDLFLNLPEISQSFPYLHIGMAKTDNTIIAYTYVQKKLKYTTPSQLLRQVVAEVIYNQPNTMFWHWRDIYMGLTTDKRLDQICSSTRYFRTITGY